MKNIKISSKALLNFITVFLCTGLILYFIFSENGLRDFLTNSRNANYKYLLLALAAHICNCLVDCIITWQMVREKYPHYKLLHGLKSTVTAHFFAAVTPGGSGGQPMQIYTMVKYGIDAGFASSVLLMKFIIYQIVTTIYTIILFIMKSKFIVSQINNRIMPAFAVLGFAFQLTLTFFLLLAGIKPEPLKKFFALFRPILKKIKGENDAEQFMKSVNTNIDTFAKSNKEAVKKPFRIILCTLQIVLQISFIYSVPYFIYKALVPLGHESFVTMFCSVAFVNAVSQVLPIPGSSGVAEAAFGIFFGTFFTKESLKSAVLIWRTITYYFSIIIEGPLSVSSGSKRKRKESDLSDEQKN